MYYKVSQLCGEWRCLDRPWKGSSSSLTRTFCESRHISKSPRWVASPDPRLDRKGRKKVQYTNQSIWPQEQWHLCIFRGKRDNPTKLPFIFQFNRPLRTHTYATLLIIEHFFFLGETNKTKRIPQYPNQCRPFGDISSQLSTYKHSSVWIGRVVAQWMECPTITHVTKPVTHITQCMDLKVGQEYRIQSSTLSLNFWIHSPKGTNSFSPFVGKESSLGNWANWEWFVYLWTQVRKSVARERGLFSLNGNRYLGVTILTDSDTSLSVRPFWVHN